MIPHVVKLILKSRALVAALVVVMFAAGALSAEPEHSAVVPALKSVDAFTTEKISSATESIEIPSDFRAPEDDSISNSDIENKSKDPELEISGFRYLKIRNYDSTGNTEEFQTREGLVNFGERVEQGTSLSIKATMGESSTLEGTFDEMPSQDRRMMFRLGHGKYEGLFGDFAANLNGGAFAPLSKSITGFQVNYATERSSVSAVISQSKSSTKTIALTGRNIRGPYDLNAYDLVPDSVEVKLNDVVLSPDEYSMEPFIGQITFNRILGPNDTVAVTYEQRLAGNLSEGAIVGLAAERKSADGKWAYGFTRLEQEANRQSQRVTEAKTDEIPTVNGRLLELSNQFIVHWDSTRGSETIIKNGSVTLEPNVDYNWQGELKPHEIDVLFAEGKFLLRAAPAPTDTFAVSYSFYPLQSSLRESLREPLFMDITGTVGYPEKATIYSGSERIYVCSDVDLTICPVLLARGDDYTVEERLNRVIFTIPINSPNEFVRIDYRYYPDTAALSSEYKHTMSDFRVAYTPSAKLAMEYERAMSEADISSRPISIVNEIILSAAADLDCSQPDITRQCAFLAANDNIVPGTALLYLNDRISAEAALKNVTDYMVDTERGEITLKINIPAGSVIIADYQYNPDIPSEPKTGSRDRLTARFADARNKASFSLDTGDTFFTPIGGSSNMETRRLAYGVARKISDRIDLSADWTNSSSALNILNTNARKTDTARYSISMSSKAFTSLRLDFDQRAVSDDYAVALTDNNENRITASIALPAPFLKNADLAAGYSSTGFKDNTPSGSDTDTVSMNVGMNWKPSPKLSLRTDLTTSDVDTDSPQLSFKSSNRSSKVGVEWTPVALVTVGADIDSQTTSDSRDTVADREIQRSSVSVSMRQYGRIRTFQFKHMRNDSPSVSGVSSGTKSSMYSTGVILTSSLTFNPSLSISDSYSGESSSSNNRSVRYDLDYSPSGSPFRAKFSIKNTTVQSNNVSGSTSTASDNWGLGVDYTPSPVWNCSASYQKDAYSSSGASAYDTGVFQIRVARKPSQSLSQWLQYRSQNRTGSAGETYSLLDMGIEKGLTKIVSLNFNYRISKFDNSNDSLRNYTGHIMETSLRATF